MTFTSSKQSSGIKVAAVFITPLFAAATYNPKLKQEVKND